MPDRGVLPSVALKFVHGHDAVIRHINGPLSLPLSQPVIIPNPTIIVIIHKQ
ncbi:MAG TPA: hypothetical protein PJ991_05810 [Kiritimatiellia bacterium]|nr:hypothetical protein [Kiritimatiellia bacterium]